MLVWGNESAGPSSTYANKCKHNGIKCEAMDEQTSQDEDDEAKEGLEAPHNGAPQGRVHHEQAAVAARRRRVAGRTLELGHL